LKHIFDKSRSAYFLTKEINLSTTAILIFWKSSEELDLEIESEHLVQRYKFFNHSYLGHVMYK